MGLLCFLIISRYDEKIRGKKETVLEVSLRKLHKVTSCFPAEALLLPMQGTEKSVDEN